MSQVHQSFSARWLVLGVSGIVGIQHLIPLDEHQSEENTLLRLQEVYQVVVSHIFYFHPGSLENWSNLTNISQPGWNHQLVFHPRRIIIFSSNTSCTADLFVVENGWSHVEVVVKKGILIGFSFFIVGSEGLDVLPIIWKVSRGVSMLALELPRAPGCQSSQHKRQESSKNSILHVEHSDQLTLVIFFSGIK